MVAQFIQVMKNCQYMTKVGRTQGHLKTGSTKDRFLDAVQTEGSGDQPGKVLICRMLPLGELDAQVSHALSQEF